MWGLWTEGASSHEIHFNVVGWEGYDYFKRVVMSNERKEECDLILLLYATGVVPIDRWMECNAENAKRSSIV